jgi:hypothetical protein
MIPYPAEVLAKRYYGGYAAILTSQGHIVSYTSLAPVALYSPGVQSWERILNQLGFLWTKVPGIDVYEFTSTWTDPAWRRKHISLAIRKPLVERFLKGDTLGVGGMIALSSANLAKLGWEILAWNAAPFVSSLVAVPCQNFPSQAATGWLIPETFAPYQGTNIPLGNPAHSWGNYCYFWVSNPALARRLNQELASLVHDNLDCWRSAIVAIFSNPGSSHRLAFLPT